MAFNALRPGSLKLPGEIEVKGNPDKAIVDSSRVRGGAWSVASLALRDTIPADLRLANVTRCWVIAEGKEYKWLGGALTNWQEVVAGGGSSGTSDGWREDTSVAFPTADNSTGVKGIMKISSDNTIVAFCIAPNTWVGAPLLPVSQLLNPTVYP
ncbi:MAG: hypothetical protein H7Y12_01375 [Sphingobacteriaceae bacterium]|nr:hypothetical protein [Cytophagaceae bacterium]